MIRPLSLAVVALVASGLVPPLDAQETAPGSGGLGGADRAVRIVAISDLNGSYGTVGLHDRVATAVERIIELRPDVVLVTGDMVAGQRPSPRLTREELASMWSAFHEDVTRPLADAGIPLAVTVGNHDGSGELSFAVEREEFRRQWQAHRPDVEFLDDDDYPVRYAFRVGPVVMAAVDASTVEGPDEAQLAWLGRTLERFREDPGVELVFGHLPPFPLTRGRERETLRDGRFAELLVREGVDLYLSGHHHAFYAGVWNGVTLVSQAALGSGPRRLLGTDTAAPRGFTVLDVHHDGSFEIRSLEAPDFREATDLTTLPPFMGGEGHRLTRLDLARGVGGF